MAYTRVFTVSSSARRTELDKHAFAGCPALEVIRFGGSAEDWERVEKSEGRDADTGDDTVIYKEF